MRHLSPKTSPCWDCTPEMQFQKARYALTHDRPKDLVVFLYGREAVEAAKADLGAKAENGQAQ
jgi:hypothetical protein